MSAANKVALVTAPVEGQNLACIPGDDWATASYIEVPEEWKTNTIRFSAEGAADWYILFSATETTVISATAESTITSNAITTVGSAPMRVKLDVPVDVDLELVGKAEKRYLLVLASGGVATDFLRMHRSSGPVGNP